MPTSTDALTRSADESTADNDNDNDNDNAIASADSEGGADLNACPPARDLGRLSWSRALAFGVLPFVALSLAVGAGWLKWQASSSRSADLAGTQATSAASEGTIALLSYRPDTVDKDLDGARNRLTGSFRDSYTSLTRDVVIPGAKQQRISAVATVPVAALMSAGPHHAVVLVFVNQTVVVGDAAPASTASSVRVSLDDVSGHWLISGFDPV